MRIDNYSVVTQLVLPDNRVLSFNYNEFGEVAEVQMPTGGKVQYDHQSVLLDSQAGTGLPAGNSLPCEVHPVAQQLGSDVASIDRAVVAMRTYPDGSTLEGNWSYGFKIDKTEVQCTNVSNTILLDQLHYYLSSQRFLVCTNGAPDGTGYSIWSTGLERRNERRDSNQTTVLTASEQDWAQRANVSWLTGYTAQQIANDYRVNEERKYLDDGSFSRVHTTYDPTIAASNHINNPSEVDEYDFDGSLKRYSTTSYLIGGHYTGTGTNTVNLLSLPTQQSVFDGGAEVARTSYEYDSYIDDGSRASLVDHGAVTGHDSGYGTTKTERGNPTQISRMINGSSMVCGTTSVCTYPRYDTLGNVISIKDPRGNVTTLDFLDDFGVGSIPGSGAQGSAGATYSLPTKITSPPPNPSEPQHTAYSQYDFNTGLLTGFKDRNGIITQTLYNDSFDRPTQIKAALGTSLENHTAMYYAPQTNPFSISLTNNDVLTAKDQASINDGNLRSWTHTDGFGRTIQGFSHDLQGDVQVATTYDGLGRVKRLTNPFRSTGDPTYGYADKVYDLAGRVTSVTTSDGAVVTTSYSGNSTTVTDQAGKKRRSITDGLGRLTRVDEPDSNGNLDTGNPPQPVQPTSYIYDVLDDLAKVTQGSQSRYFMYDSLNRLIRARNPEQDTNTNLSLSDPLTGNNLWSVKYVYDENSNLSTRTDARGTLGIKTTYIYDALNRVKSRTYTNDPQNTPAVSYKYDNQTPPPGAPTFTQGSSIGRLVAVTYGTGSAGSYQGYDQLGRVNVSYQQTDSINYGFSYGYNLASEMTSETYPSGRQVITEYDTAGRIAGVKKDALTYYAGATASDATNRIQYAPQGAVSVMKLGNGKWEHTNFNNRLQPTQIGLGTSGTDSSVLKLDYGYGTTTNNGNVASQTITIGSTVMNQTYGYDALNRLSSASENSGASWSQSNGFDRYGNRWVSGYVVPGNESRTPPSQSAFNAATNRINPAVMPGFGYDGAGNVTSDPTTPAEGIVYDAENRQVSYTKAGATTTYSYDGDGRRVKKVVGNVTTIFVYNALGQLIAEYTNDTVPPVGGGGTSYLTSDHLGSTRVVMKSDGTTVKARYDYLPFGEEIPTSIGGRSSVAGYGGGDSTKQKFTQKERDTESGLDYFLARYYSSAEGRFTSVDLAGPDITNPQTLNKYRYGLNNPLRYVDPNGAQEKESWIEGLRRYLSSLFESKAKVRTEEDARPQQPSNPYGLTEEEIVQYHLQGLGQGSRTLFNVVSTLDPTGGSSVLQSFMDRDKGGVALGMAGMVGGPALSKIFGVGNRALTSGELLVGRLGAAEVAAQFSKSGGTLVADVVGVFGAKSQGLASSTKALFNSIMGFAKQEGLSEVRVQAVAVVNKDLEERLIKQGWQKTTVIVDGEKVSAYTRTFQVR